MWSVIKAVNISPWSIKGKLDYVDDWYLMSSPVPILAIWLAYLAFVLKVGPIYMKGRPPFQLKNVLIAYNIVQVLISSALFIKALIIFGKYGLIRSDCLTDTPEAELTVVTGFYYYFLAKVSELAETIFFVLRKKYRQVSFLHLYHHSLMILITWSIIKFEPSPSVRSVGTLNAFVHIVMYIYYTLSSFPNLRKYLWWKSLITQLQLLQFIAMVIWVSIEYQYSSCKPSLILLGSVLFNTALMIALFTNFYLKSYRTKNKSKMIDNSSNMEQVNGAKYNNTDKKKNYSQDIFSNGVFTKENKAFSNGKHGDTKNSKREVTKCAELSNGNSHRKRN